MRSVVLKKVGQFETIERKRPARVKLDDVLLKVAAVGVCGSDIHYFKEGRIGHQMAGFPFIAGHECSAVVMETGPGVKSLQRGDRVAIDPAISCNQCPQCLSGRPHTCLNLKFLGNPGELDGCLSDFIVMPERCCYAIDPEMSLAEAVLVEPLSIGIYAVELAQLPPSARIAVLGAGPIGLSTLIASRQAHPSEIVVTDLLPGRQSVARDSGADFAGFPADLDHMSGGFDVVFECCGKQEALDQAINVLNPGGRLMIIGIPSSDRVSLDSHLMRRKEISIQNVRRQNDCMQKAIDLIADKNVPTGQWITHRFDPQETQQAFELVAAYGQGVIKALIDFKRPGHDRDFKKRIEP